MVESMK